MPKIWRAGDEKKFCRELKLNTPYYVIRATGRTQQPFHDPYYADTVIFTDRLPLTGNPCTKNGYSAETLLRLDGPVYDSPPTGIRNLDDPAPNYAPNSGCVDGWLGF